jgi:hypothetical protein
VPASGGGGPRGRPADRGGARGRPRAGDRPPGPEARQRQAVPRRCREDPGLRPRPGSGGILVRVGPVDVADPHHRQHPGRRHPRHGRLHEPRAGPRASDRPAHRHLGLRLRGLRAADGRPCVPGRHRLGHPGGGPPGGAGPGPAPRGDAAEAAAARRALLAEGPPAAAAGHR